MPEITNDAAGFACNRPGVGASAEAATPRDGAHIVAALHALHELPQSQRVRPPDALVGYSLGGLYMQLYARQHRGATQVWVDSGHENPLDQPQAVIDAVRAVLACSRASAR